MSKKLLDIRLFNLFFYLFKNCSFNNIQNNILSDDLIKFFINYKFCCFYYFFFFRMLNKLNNKAIYYEYLVFFCSGYNLFYFKHYRLICFLEFFLRKNKFFTFTSRFFSKKLKKNKLYVYNDFILRIPAKLLFYMGRHAEFLRVFKYNEYISNTNILHDNWPLKSGLRLPYQRLWQLFQRQRYHLFLNRYSMYSLKMKKVEWSIDFFHSGNINVPNLDFILKKFSFSFFSSINFYFSKLFKRFFKLYILSFLFISWQKFRMFWYFKKFRSKTQRLYLGLSDCYFWFFRPFRFTWRFILSRFFIKDVIKLSKNIRFSITDMLYFNLIDVKAFKIFDLKVVSRLSVHFLKLIQYFDRTYWEQALLYFRLLWNKFSVYAEINFLTMSNHVMYLQNDGWKYYLKKVKYNVDKIFWQIMFSGIHKKYEHLYKDPYILFKYQDVEKFIIGSNNWYNLFLICYLKKYLSRLYINLFFYLYMCVFGDLCSKFLFKANFINRIYILNNSYNFYLNNIYITQYKYNFWKLREPHQWYNYQKSVLMHPTLNALCSDYPLNIEKYWDLMDTSRW